MKLFGRTKNIIDKIKNGGNKSINIVLFQYNLVDNQCQEKSEVLYTFMPKDYAYLLNVEPSIFKNLKHWVWWNNHNIYGSKWWAIKNRRQS